MTNEQHENLLTVAKSMKGQVVISAYENDLYNDCLPTWRKVSKSTEADGSIDGAVKRVELLYISPNCVSAPTLFTN